MTPIFRALPVVVAMFGLTVVPLSAAHAQGTPPSTQGPSPADAFLANPSGLLGTYPLGGGAMVSAVRDLVQADPKTVDALLTLVASANEDQKNAIGTGLGLAAMALVRTNPQEGTIIQDAIVKLNDKTLLASYAAVTGNLSIAAAGGAGAGGAGGGGESATGAGGPAGGIDSPSSVFPNFFTKNVADSFTIPLFTSGSPGTPTTTVGGPVSPTTP